MHFQKRQTSVEPNSGHRRPKRVAACNIQELVRTIIFAALAFKVLTKYLFDDMDIIIWPTPFLFLLNVQKQGV